MQILTATGDLVTIAEFNKNHDPDGRFGSGGNSYTDLDMTREEFDKFSAGYGMSASKEEIDLISDYQNSEARPINMNLKQTEGKADKVHLSVGNGKASDTTPYFIDTYGQRRVDVVNTMDNNMKHELKQNTYLYRGMSIDADLKAGDSLKSYGYASTSFSKDIAGTFTFNGIRYRTDNTKEYVLKIKAPKGTKGMIPHDLTGARTIEQEYILPRGMDFKITKVLGPGMTKNEGMYQPDYHYTVLEVEI